MLLAAGEDALKQTEVTDYAADPDEEGSRKPRREGRDGNF
jgi:hypothetical protein